MDIAYEILSGIVVGLGIGALMLILFAIGLCIAEARNQIRIKRGREQKPDRKEPSFGVSDAQRAPSDGVSGIKGYYHLSRAQAIAQGIEVSPPATDKEKANG